MATHCFTTLIRQVPIRVAARSRGLRHGSEAARLLGLRVRIPPTAWMSVCCACYVLPGDIFAMCRSFVQRSPADCSVSKYDRGTSTVRRRRASTAVELWRNRNKQVVITFTT